MPPEIKNMDLAQRICRSLVIGPMHLAKIPHLACPTFEFEYEVDPNSEPILCLEQLLLLLIDKKINEPHFGISDVTIMTTDMVQLREGEPLEQHETTFRLRDEQWFQTHRDVDKKNIDRLQGSERPTHFMWNEIQNRINHERAAQKTFDDLIAPIRELFYSTETRKLLTEAELKRELADASSGRTFSEATALQSLDPRKHCDPVKVAHITVHKMHEALEAALELSRRNRREKLVTAMLHKQEEEGVSTH